MRPTATVSFSSPEARTILLASSADGSSAMQARLRAAASQVTRWDAVVQIAIDNGVAALMYAPIRDTDAPRDVVDLFRRRYLSNAAKNLAALRELRRLLDALGEAGVRAAVYKGLVLAQTAFRDIAAREISDSDLIIRPSDVRKAFAILEQLGYRRAVALTSHQEERTIRENCEVIYVPANGVGIIDLHWGFTTAHFPFRLDFAEMTTADADVGGVVVPTFGIDETALVLAHHGSKHLWERLEWIASFAAFARTQPIDWARTRELADSAGARKQLYLAAWLAHEFFDLPLPESFRDIATYANDFDRLRQLVVDRIFEERSAVFDARLLARYTPLLFEQRWARHAVVMRSLFQPMLPDWQLVRLPKRLWFLYWLVRPLRLTGKYLGRFFMR